VDLASSERGPPGTRGPRNADICRLQQVIAQLGDRRRQEKRALFRASRLTMLLQDSLQGACRTCVVACVSAKVRDLPETLATLRIGVSFRKVRTSRVPRDADPRAVVADDLRRLKLLEGSLVHGPPPELAEEVRLHEQLLAQLKRPLDQALREEQERAKVRDEMVREMGVLAAYTYDAQGNLVDDDDMTPYLCNISDDINTTGVLVYLLKPGHATTIGSDEESAITLRGLGVPKLLCTVTNDNGSICVFLPEQDDDAKRRRVLVNGRLLDEPQHLQHGDRLVLGRAGAMKLCNPATQFQSMTLPAGSGDEVAGPAEPTLDSVLSEVALEESDAFCELNYYVEELSSKMNEEKMQAFNRELRVLCPLVDEANEITREVRPNEGLKLEVEFVWDIYCCAPREILLVRLMEPEGDGQDLKVRAYWTMPRFEEKLELMRLAHDAHLVGAPVDPLLDPWEDLSQRWMEQRIITEREEVSQSALDAMDFLAGLPPGASRPSFSGTLVGAAALRRGAMLDRKANDYRSGLSVRVPRRPARPAPRREVAPRDTTGRDDVTVEENRDATLTLEVMQRTAVDLCDRVAFDKELAHYRETCQRQLEHIARLEAQVEELQTDKRHLQALLDRPQELAQTAQAHAGATTRLQPGAEETWRERVVVSPGRAVAASPERQLPAPGGNQSPVPPYSRAMVMVNPPLRQASSTGPSSARAGSPPVGSPVFQPQVRVERPRLTGRSSAADRSGTVSPPRYAELTPVGAAPRSAKGAAPRVVLYGGLAAASYDAKRFPHR